MFRSIMQERSSSALVRPLYRFSVSTKERHLQKRDIFKGETSSGSWFAWLHIAPQHFVNHDYMVLCKRKISYNSKRGPTSCRKILNVEAPWASLSDRYERHNKPLYYLLCLYLMLMKRNVKPMTEPSEAREKSVIRAVEDISWITVLLVIPSTGMWSPGNIKQYFCFQSLLEWCKLW